MRRTRILVNAAGCCLIVDAHWISMSVPVVSYYLHTLDSRHIARIQNSDFPHLRSKNRTSGVRIAGLRKWLKRKFSVQCDIDCCACARSRREGKQYLRRIELADDPRHFLTICDFLMARGRDKKSTFDVVTNAQKSRNIF